MPDVEVRVPIRIRLVGLPTATDLARLEDAVALLVARRAAQAGQALAARPGTTAATAGTADAAARYEAGFDTTGDGGYSITSHQGPARQVRVPLVRRDGAGATAAGTDAARQAAVRRVTELLSTGILDWAVTDAEAREALRILLGLAPVDLMRAVQALRLTGRLAVLGREAPADAHRDLTELRSRIDPHEGYLMPGDTVSVEVFLGTARQRDVCGDHTLGSGGLALPLLDRVVEATGLRPARLPDLIARAYTDAKVLTDPYVKVAVAARGPLYAPWHGPTRGLLWYASTLRERTARARPGGAPEAQAPPESPRRGFLALATTMRHAATAAAPAERLRLAGTLADYLAWLGARTDDALTKEDPATVWTRLSLARLKADVTTEVAARFRRERRTADDTAAQARWEAARRKLDATLEFLRVQLARPRDPYRVEDRERSTGYLVWQSARESAVRDLIANAFLRDAVAAAHRPDFATTSVAADFQTWLAAHPAEYRALLAARAYPETESYEIRVDIPAWQIAIEVGVGLIPVVGSIVAAGEAALGYDLFGNRLSTVDRAVLAAAVLLPAAAKVFKAGRAVVTVATLSRDYGLSTREAEVAYRALTRVRPGTAGARVLESAARDVRAGRPMRDAKRLTELGGLFDDMGLTDRATVDELRAGAAESALGGHAGRPGQEAADLFASADEAAELVGAAESRAARPVVRGGKKPHISDTSVPTTKRTRTDIEHLPRQPGETGRAALQRVRRVIGRRIDQTPLNEVWAEARRRVVGDRSLEHATRQEMVDLYDRVRDRFWLLARDGGEIEDFLRRAGFEFPAQSGRKRPVAPLLVVVDPPPGTGLPKAADLSLQERRVSLDHNLEKALGENHRRALDADNLTFELHNPNSDRETVQVRFGLRPGPGEAE
ncbi:pre-toxin TG domain-containing protein [Actinocorallia sp. API 0066]|uniref:pre-toxin TG domain-containing protein n=1 Tax=Actinocorallia sp. API 0066 TaxID=2896846 RepID=UPI001E4C1582|nr:pre-toxin TG domain-containing protein [Actinocorallia sp. API 0066]MCD0449192.1 pre-toxin TG domain-containing protein [Actinocorallia sp. API 0066]